MKSHEFEAYLPQLEANILTAGIATWVLQNNIDPYSKEFEDAADTVIACRDCMLTQLSNHYKREELT